VPETAIGALYWRASESRRPDALVKDERAEALVTQLDYDFDRIRGIPMPELLKVMRAMLTRQFDRCARDFLGRHPDGVVVHMGCGLDSRFERVDNGRVEWYDLDVPDVIDLRRTLIGNEGGHYHLLPFSMGDSAGLDEVELHAPRPFLVVAETALVYLREGEVKSLVLALRDRLPGAELVFDGWRPFEVWLGNRYLSVSGSPFAGLMHWGMWRGPEIEHWGHGIALVDEWGFFDHPEPRLTPFRWMAPLFRLFKPVRVFRFRLEETDPPDGGS
jgi:O-methyltransferase involved in polyketide biosynthesis